MTVDMMAKYLPGGRRVDDDVKYIIAVTHYLTWLWFKD